MTWINPAAQAELVQAANEKPAKLIHVLTRYAFNKPINRRVYGVFSWLYGATTDPDVLKKMFNASTGQ
jgi:hypothetical protein